MKSAAEEKQRQDDAASKGKAAALEEEKRKSAEMKVTEEKAKVDAAAKIEEQVRFCPIS